jgi:hypothetical protein
MDPANEKTANAFFKDILQQFKTSTEIQDIKDYPFIIPQNSKGRTVLVKPTEGQKPNVGVMIVSFIASTSKDAQDIINIINRLPCHSNDPFLCHGLDTKCTCRVHRYNQSGHRSFKNGIHRCAIKMSDFTPVVPSWHPELIVEWKSRVHKMGTNGKCPAPISCYDIDILKSLEVINHLEKHGNIENTYVIVNLMPGDPIELIDDMSSLSKLFEEREWYDYALELPRGSVDPQDYRKTGIDKSQDLFTDEMASNAAKETATRELEEESDGIFKVSELLKPDMVRIMDFRIIRNPNLPKKAKVSHFNNKRTIVFACDKKISIIGWMNMDRMLQKPTIF